VRRLRTHRAIREVTPRAVRLAKYEKLIGVAEPFWRGVADVCLCSTSRVSCMIEAPILLQWLSPLLDLEESTSELSRMMQQPRYGIPRKFSAYRSCRTTSLRKFWSQATNRSIFQQWRYRRNRRKSCVLCFLLLRFGETCHSIEHSAELQPSDGRWRWRKQPAYSSWEGVGHLVQTQGVRPRVFLITSTFSVRGSTR
jgi:hypothetical protein